ncbi:MAG: hypothetical protein ACI9TV_002399 [Sulfurimonas sp.]|jgi:hypothetical protein|uniref:hypothetical protein n=1 Tax=Sulfurimonas sp. TaxID=2022749 RepID=UPI0039E3BC64
MKLEDIYTILKDSDSSDFYVPTRTKDLTFVYLDDVQLSISKLSEEKVFDYNHFFDENNKSRELPVKHDELVRDLCELKNFPESYNNISVEDWAIKYNGEVIYTISCMNISNLSSLHISFPSSLDTFDFIMNFCKICNYYYGANTTSSGEHTIIKKSNIKESTFEYFLYY